MNTSEDQFLRDTLPTTESPHVSPSELRKFTFPSQVKRLSSPKENPFFSNIFMKDYGTIAEATSEQEVAISGRSIVSSRLELSERKKLSGSSLIQLRKMTYDSNHDNSGLINISPILSPSSPLKAKEDRNFTFEGKESARIDTLVLSEGADEAELDKLEGKTLDIRRRSNYNNYIDTKASGGRALGKSILKKNGKGSTQITVDVTKTRLARIREIRSIEKIEKIEKVEKVGRTPSPVAKRTVQDEKKKKKNSGKKSARKKGAEEAPTPQFCSNTSNTSIIVSEEMSPGLKPGRKKVDHEEHLQFHAKASILLSEENEHNVSRGRSREGSVIGSSIAINTSQSMLPLMKRPSAVMSEILKDSEPAEIESPLPKISERRGKRKNKEKKEDKESKENKGKSDKKKGKKRKEAYEVKSEENEEKNKNKKDKKEDNGKVIKVEKVENTTKKTKETVKKEKEQVKKKDRPRSPIMRKQDGLDREKPKRILITDGLNLIKIMTDRTNQKKTKLFIMMFTLTVLWSILLNALEFGFLFNSKCKTSIEIEFSFLSLLITIALKIFCISFFNLELTFKQPYRLLHRLLYPFVFHLSSPILQIPQNVYDFKLCRESNHIITLEDSRRYQQAILASITILFIYLSLKKGLSAITTKSRLFGFVNKTIKCFMVMFGLAWNVILVIVFSTQKDIFLPSFFFDFYLYIVLMVCTVLLYKAKSKFGEDKVKSVFIKAEKVEIVEQPTIQMHSLSEMSNLLATSPNNRRMSKTIETKVIHN